MSFHRLSIPGIPVLHQVYMHLITSPSHIGDEMHAGLGWLHGMLEGTYGKSKASNAKAWSGLHMTYQ
jgi:hypothetical protein